MYPQKTTTLLPPGRPFRYSLLEFPPGSGIQEMEFHGTAHFGVVFSGDQNFRLVGGMPHTFPGGSLSYRSVGGTFSMEQQPQRMPSDRIGFQC